ncbi:MAG: type II toxin-antitoxin system RelE/ParE family toxin [Candidatus Solibacter usitatus]|nr:type II toxin-antitoxin system RelE/ParE family toxin [Candidatus Solibacter usitatus]
MANYSVLIKASAAKELEATPKKDRERLAARMRGLAANPRPIGSEKPSGEGKFRVRQGDYRVLYLIEDANSTITIVKIGHRREVYRN